jgi:hypothetical protein
MAYEHVNNEWPSGTNAGRTLKPTAEEAATATKKLWRKWMKKPFPWTIRITSGNRNTWIRRGGVYALNPDMDGGGWHEVVHMISHLVAYRLHPGVKAHSAQHHFIEREMVKHVVASGWLDGKLKRPEKPPVDRRKLETDRIAARLKRWKTRRKRADTAIRRLEQQLRRRLLVASV